VDLENSHSEQNVYALTVGDAGIAFILTVSFDLGLSHPVNWLI
jgi:hypothetical protein